MFLNNDTFCKVFMKEEIFVGERLNLVNEMHRIVVTKGDIEKL